MSWFFKLLDSAGVNVAGVNTSNEVKVVTAQDRSGVAIFSENDDGTFTGERYALSPETDDDFRLRVSLDNPLDFETFNYTAQNTGKHNYLNTTMANSWTAAGMTTNSGNITTTTTATRVRTYAYFPLLGPGVTYIEAELAFTAQPTANTAIDFGLFIDGGSNPFTPTDGVYFRLNAVGLSGVTNSNTTETETAFSGFTYNNNQVYQFIIAVHEREIEFWIDGELKARVSTPIALGQPFMSAGLPFAIRHAIAGGAAGSTISAVLKDYNVSIGGIAVSDPMGVIKNRILGSYQGLSGGTMGSLSNIASNVFVPTAAVPSTTALTANLINGLGGECYETDTLATNQDGILMSYQIPAGTANVQGKRLKITGVKIDAWVQTALTGGGYNGVYQLNFGHTAVSLGTTETASAKAPRRLYLGQFSVASAAAVLTTLGTIQVTLSNPVYVNPGEFVAISKKKLGTAPSAGVIGHGIYLDYSWE